MLEGISGNIVRTEMITMRSEVWGLRKADTQEPVYIHRASSNRHRPCLPAEDGELL